MVTSTGTIISGTSSVRAAVLPPTILCFGDSLTAGWSPPRMERFPYATFLQAILGANATVRHKGYPGWTATQLLESADSAEGLRTLIQRETDPSISMVILLVGTNDLTNHQFGPLDITKSIQGLHELAHEEGVPHTLAIQIPPSQFQTLYEEVGTTARQVNKLLEEYSQNSTSKTTFVKFPFDWERNSDLWSPDGIHFSPRGYQLLGESLAPMVKTILQLG